MKVNFTSKFEKLRYNYYKLYLYILFAVIKKSLLLIVSKFLSGIELRLASTLSPSFCQLIPLFEDL